MICSCSHQYLQSEFELLLSILHRSHHAHLYETLSNTFSSRKICASDGSLTLCALTICEQGGDSGSSWRSRRHRRTACRVSQQAQQC